MVEISVCDKETRLVFIKELRSTRGWEILKTELLQKRKLSVRYLTTGSPSNIEIKDVIVERARLKLIDEILNSVSETKEDYND
jgi:hypothetical protein